MLAARAEGEAAMVEKALGELADELIEAEAQEEADEEALE